MKSNEKIKLFFERKQKVHVSCNTSRFYNGEIIELNDEKGFLILMDLKLGEVPIMFEEIHSIEPFLVRS